MFNASQAVFSSSAVVRQSLGRDLSACRGAATCTATVTVPLVPSAADTGNASAELFDDRINVTDLRLTKQFPLGKGTIKGVLDIYNAFNNRPPLTINTTYGAAWQTPTSIQGGRLIEFGAQINF